MNVSEQYALAYQSNIEGRLRNYDGNANENVATRYKLTLVVLFCDYSNSFNLYNMAELSSNRTGKNDVQNLPSYAHVLYKTLNGVFSRCFFGRGGRRSTPKLKTHVKGLLFCNALVASP